jgi:hypothetical protein
MFKRLVPFPVLVGLLFLDVGQAPAPPNAIEANTKGMVSGEHLHNVEPSWTMTILDGSESPQPDISILYRFGLLEREEHVSGPAICSTFAARCLEVGEICD